MKLRLIAIVLSLVLGFCYPYSFAANQTSILTAFAAIAFISLGICAGHFNQDKLWADAYQRAMGSSLSCLQMEFFVAGALSSYLALLSFCGLISFPSAVIGLISTALMMLICAAACKKGLLSPFLLPLQCTIYVAGFIFASLILSLLGGHTYWGEPASLTADFGSRVAAQTISVSINIFLSIACTLPLIYLVETAVHRRLANAGSLDSKLFGPMCHTLMIALALATTLPILYFPLTGQSLFELSSEQFAILRNVFPVCFALSTIPASLAGMSIAFYGWYIPTTSFRPLALLGLCLLTLGGGAVYGIYALQPSACHTIRATIFEVAGQYRRALDDYDRAIELDPENADAYGWRGYTYAKLRNPEKAANDLDKAVSLDHSKPVFLLRCATIYNDLKRYQDLIALCSRIIEQDPSSRLPYYFRGRGYLETGDIPNAKADFNRFFAMRSNDPEAFLARGYMYFRLNDYTAAINDINKAIELAPNSQSAAYKIRAEISLKLGQPGKAISDLTKAIEISPHYYDAFRLRSQAYEALGDTKRAKADLNQAKDLGPVNYNGCSCRKSI